MSLDVVTLQMLGYCPVAGTFKSAAKPDNTGYIRIRVGGTKYKAHRLAWLIHYGAWPSGHLDHINGIKHDNRISNLREVTNKQNHENRRGANKGSGTGVLGVSFNKRLGKYLAHIRHNDKLHYLGLFPTVELATQARQDKERELFTHTPLNKGT